jgi:hypothetical protein
MLPPTACEPLEHLSWRDGLRRTSPAGRGGLFLVVAVVSFALATAWTDRQMAGLVNASAASVELIYVPPPRFLRAVSLRYERAVADVLWFRTISYFGQHYRSDRLYPWLAYMCDVVTELDPRAIHVYRFGGVILPWEADHIDDGIALLEKGTRNLPEAWELRYMLGFSYYFFKNDLPNATATLRAAALTPGAPAYVGQLTAAVVAAQHGPSNAIDFLQEVERTGNTAEMRGAIHQRVLDLAVSRDLDALEAAVKTFQDRFGRVPDDLHELVSTGLLAKIPLEPFGGRYVLDAQTGAVASSTGHKRWRLGSSQQREAILKKQRAGD